MVKDVNDRLDGETESWKKCTGFYFVYFGLKLHENQKRRITGISVTVTVTLEWAVTHTRARDLFNIKLRLI